MKLKRLLLLIRRLILLGQHLEQKILILKPMLVNSGCLTFNINNFLNLSISASSKNSVIFRYLQEYFDTDGVEIPGEKNVFKDLYDSFAFWDENKRKASGFKMKSLSINLTHELHDWTFASEFTVSPRLEKGKYDYSPYFSMAVVWRPMASIKTKIEDKYGEFTLNPSDD